MIKINSLLTILYLFHCFYWNWAVQDHNWSTEAKIAHELLYGEKYESFN
jgi:hypothetical protein